MVVAETDPRRGSAEERWWLAGAKAEARLREEGRSDAGRQVADFVDAIARAEHHHRDSEADIARFTFNVFALAGTSFRQRLRLALWVLRDGKGRI